MRVLFALSLVLLPRRRREQYAGQMREVFAALGATWPPARRAARADPAAALRAD